MLCVSANRNRESNTNVMCMQWPMEELIAYVRIEKLHEQLLLIGYKYN